MERIKIFCSDYFENPNQEDFKNIQKEVNKWLEKNPEYKVKNIYPSTLIDKDGDGRLIFTIHYSTDGDNLF